LLLVKIRPVYHTAYVLASYTNRNGAGFTSRRLVVFEYPLVVSATKHRY